MGPRPMQAVLAVLCVAAVAHAVRVPPSGLSSSLGGATMKGNQFVEQEFKSWLTKHEKQYKSDVKEYALRLRIFEDNLKFIMAHNAKGKSYTLGPNRFADLTHEEFKAMHLGVKPGQTFKPKRSPNAVEEFDYHDTVPAKGKDWRKEGAVTPVKNQAACGSCWSFSTTGAVEGINQIVTGKLVTLSEQELLDCDTTKDHGCNGGLMDFAFDFILKNGGIDTEEDYPYKAEEDACEIDKENDHVVTIDGHKDVPENDESALKKALHHQPVSVAIEADQREFQLYTGGVFDDACGTALDHGVLAVGYSMEVVGNTTGHWIVKNSWGPEWGSEGFILMAMNRPPEGICGIAMAASYPLKTGPNPDPTPDPGPIKCDSMHTCPAGSTCCCAVELGNFCFAWGCCPTPEATCCEDHKHCCPKERPVCDLEAATCAPEAGSALIEAVPWLEKQPAILDEAAAEAAGLKRTNPLGPVVLEGEEKP